MQQFFSSLVELEQFSLSLNSHSTSNSCPHCCQNDQWVSHGYLYKQTGEKVGKRILCAKRYGKQGCGRTRQLYLQQVIPGRRYTLSTLLAFVLALIHGATVEQAYFKALGHEYQSPRQAWRWLNALWSQMSVFRGEVVDLPDLSSKSIRRRSRRLSVLLSTLRDWWHYCSDKWSIQCCCQARFC